PRPVVDRPIIRKCGARRRRELGYPAAIGANGLIDHALRVEPAGAAIHMIAQALISLAVGTLDLTKKTAVKLTGRILLQYKKIKIVVIRSRPDGARRGRQTGSTG